MGGGGGVGDGVGAGGGIGLGGLGTGSWFRFDRLMAYMMILRCEGWRCDDDILRTLPDGEWFRPPTEAASAPWRGSGSV